MRTPLSELTGLPATEETWIAGSVPVYRWIVTKRGRALRPDAFLVLSEASVVGVRVEPEGPGPARALDLLAEMMAEPLSGTPRRPSRIRVGTTATAKYLAGALSPLGIDVETGDVTGPLTERIRTVEQQATGGFPLRGLREIPGIDPTRLAAFYGAAARFHRLEPWISISDAEPFEVTCEAWSRTTWYASLMGAVGEVTGIALHPTWRSLLAIFEGRDESAVPDALALTFGDRTQVPFDDLDAIADHGFDVDGNGGYPLVFRSRPGEEVAGPTLEEFEIVEACLLAFAAYVTSRKGKAPSAIVEVETSAGRRRVTLRRRR